MTSTFCSGRPEKAIKVVTCDGVTGVFLKGRPYMSWQSGDEGCARVAMAQLYQCGQATQEELAGAFGRHVTSVQRYITQLARQGVRGLMPESRGPKGGWKITAELRAKILLIVLRESTSSKVSAATSLARSANSEKHNAMT